MVSTRRNRSMRQEIKRWAVTAAAAAALAIGAFHAPSQVARAQEAPAQTGQRDQLATVEQLKSEAFKALRGGNFDRSDELLSKAAALSGDQSLAQMSQWLGQYKSARHDLVVERQKQYSKAVGEVQKLLDAGKDDFAVNRAADALVLADDKDKFRAEPWVKSLLTKTTSLAAKAEMEGRWVRALRLYGELNSIDPQNQEYKDKLKATTRHVRLLAMYTPDEFKELLTAESKEREAADALLKEPTTQPSTLPTTRPFSDNDSFKVDWRDTLRGVQYSMLFDALDDAKINYWKDLNYRTLLIGGLKGAQALATTQGLEKAFPGLADTGKRDAFLEVVNRSMDAVNDLARPEDQQAAVRKVVATIRLANRQTVDLPEQVLVNEFADGAFGELDPFSNILWPSELEEFNKSTQGEFGGIGIQIMSDDDLNLKVVSPVEDTPAYKAGVKAGDLITRINGKDAKGISTTLAVKHITGPIGTDVTLTIKAALDGKERDITLRRANINVASVKGWKRLPGGAWDYFIDPKQSIAYVRLTNFTKHSADDMRSAVKELEARGARGVILDLRSNPGGLLQIANEICDKFLTGGTIVSTRADRDNPAQPPTSTEARKDRDDCTLPMVVIVNQLSASASEIVSGALKDQKRATIVGERTFGKGSVQMVFSLAGRSAYLKLTTSHYYLPSGKCIHKEENSTTWGVEPDVVVEMTPKQMVDAVLARQDQEVLRDVNDVIPAPTTQPKKDVLATDPQLAAALLVMRLQLAGASL